MFKPQVTKVSTSLRMSKLRSYQPFPSQMPCDLLLPEDLTYERKAGIFMQTRDMNYLNCVSWSGETKTNSFGSDSVKCVWHFLFFWKMAKIQI